MNYLRQNRSMTIAVTISVLVHAALLAVRFVAPDAFKLEPADPGLEVILVNAKHDKKPLKADAIAQANLEGGGNAAAGRAKSPLPDLRKMEAGDSVKAAQRRIAELEQRQQNLLTQARATNFNAAPITEKDKPDPTRTGADLMETAKAIARSTAEITNRIEDENKRPRKTMITPSTREAGYAMYYTAMTKRIEDIGTLNFPQVNGRKLYGELVLSIPIYQDGTIYMKEGGIKVERSSGNADLDRAAINIVRRSAPFGRFPPNMLSSDRDDLWMVVTTFRFKRNDSLETQLRGGGQ
ncbi:MAG: TonB family protein [Pseudomonadota bacterium]